MSRRRPGYRYGRYVDGPDPLAAPLDLRSAMEQIGRDVMEGSSPRTALQELLRRGLEVGNLRFERLCGGRTSRARLLASAP